MLVYVLTTPALEIYRSQHFTVNIIILSIVFRLLTTPFSYEFYLNRASICTKNKGDTLAYQCICSTDN